MCVEDGKIEQPPLRWVIRWHSRTVLVVMSTYIGDSQACTRAPMVRLNRTDFNKIHSREYPRYHSLLTLALTCAPKNGMEGSLVAVSLTLPSGLASV